MDDRSRSIHAEPVRPYTALAAGYDFVMSHVDYESWAAYVQDLLELHRPEAASLLELGCGTGSFALQLQPRGGYRYVATDGSEAMLEVARRKADEVEADIHFKTADFADFHVGERFDAVLLLYDGLNYLLEKSAVLDMLRCTHAAIVDGGIFIVDQSTPANSVNNERYFESSDSREDFSYVRRSRFDPSSDLHRTTIELRVGNRSFKEQHVQRAYRLADVQTLVEEAGFFIEAAYDGFSTDAASESSERVHWVLRRRA